MRVALEEEVGEDAEEKVLAREEVGQEAAAEVAEVMPRQLWDPRVVSSTVMQCQMAPCD